MKRKISQILCIGVIGALILGSMVSFTGCSLLTEEDEMTEVTPVYYLSEEELPEDAFYIVRTVEVTQTSLTGNEETYDETRYYPLYQAENTIDEIRDTYEGYEPERIEWVNYDVDEGLIPTMYATDKMIYKSSTKIPSIYTMEKFFDNGYTLGVMGLKQDLSGNYRYYGPNESTQTSFTMSKSDATGFDQLEGVETIYFAQVGDDRVTPLNVSLSGTITGLDFEKQYECDIRQGTEKIAATLTCNIHYFSSAETYLFGSFTFITPIIAQINIPDYVTTGYYDLNGGGFYRYVADESITNWKELSHDDYNATIYTYDEDGNVDGTSIGCIFDENGFLVTGEMERDDASLKKSGLSYSQLMEDSESKDADTGNSLSDSSSGITHITKMKPDNGVYSGTYVVTSLSEPMISNSKYVYTLTAMNIDNNEELDMKYAKTASKVELVAGETYTITFREAGSGFDGYELLTAIGPDGSETEEETDIESEEIDAELAETDTETVEIKAP